MKNNKQEFIMCVGLVGSGKSTYSTSTFPEHAYLSSDGIIEFVADKLGKTYNAVFDDIIGPAQKYVDAQLELASLALENIVLDQTNLTKKSRNRKLKLLKNGDKYKKIAIYFDTPENIINLRLQKRNKSGKIISKSLLKRMTASFEMPTLDEGFDEIKVISV